MFEFLLGMALLLGCSGVANAVTPKVAAGLGHTVALHADGTLRAWGDDRSGQLGLGRRLESLTPIAASGLAGVITVAARKNHTIALKADGSVWAWGSNSSGQLGDGSTLDCTTPKPVPGLSGMVAIAAGSSHTVALKADGSVWTWGANLDGQLGDGSKKDRATPAVVSGVSGVIAIAAGDAHTLVLKADGSVWAWGNNDSGQLGNGNLNSRAIPAVVPGLSGVIAIAAGDYHSVALKSGGSVVTWGYNDDGELGDGSTKTRTTPVSVAGLTGVTAIAAGSFHTFALKSDGSVKAWGFNEDGELGDGSNTSRTIPVNVTGLAGVIAIAAGISHSMAIKADRSVWAWGLNDDGELGNGSRIARANPVVVPGLSAIVAIAAGAYHSVALKIDGSVWIWGDNSAGQLGDGGSTSRSLPAAVPTLAGIIDVAAGGNHTAALKADGSLLAWGSNDSGELGDGTTVARSTAIAVPGIGGVSAIAAGFDYTVALKTDGTVWTWGSNGDGQLGDGSNDDRSAPGLVPGLSGVVAIAVGSGVFGSHTVALKSDGSVWAWGLNNYGQLGNGSTTDRTTPGVVPGLTGIIAIAAGGGLLGGHTLALKGNGSVWTWGANFDGQLGDGSTTDRHTPGQVPGFTGVTAIAAGGEMIGGHTLALKSDGSVWAWGNNTFGQIGNDNPQGSLSTPVTVRGLTGAIAIAAGSDHSLAIKADGSIAAWGNNQAGQLGDGTFAERRAPILVINLSADGFLNLSTGSAIIPPPELKVPFFVSSSGGITDTSALVSTVINFNAAAFDRSATATGAFGSANKFTAADAGASGAVYVTGWVPRTALATLGITNADSSLIITRTSDNPKLVSAANLHITQGTLAATDASSFVLVQKTAAGWQLVVNGQLIPYATGVLNDQLASQKILDGIDTTNLKGAVFCLGYGTSAPEMTTSGRMRAVATIPDPNSSVAASVSCIVQGVPVALRNFSDSWWNANESGWGITITDHGSNAFVQWYTYDQSGHNQKYVISGGTFSADKCQFSGAIMRVTGPSWTLPSFDPNQVARTTAGSGTIDFCPAGLAANTIVFNYTADGVTGSKQLTRLAFGNDVPQMGGTANTGAADFTDLWYNTAESGWGVSVTQHGNNIFFRVFVYDTDGRPLLFIVPGVTFTSATSFTGSVILTTGPWFGSNPFDPNQVNRTTAGTASLSFSDANNGVLTYTINGVMKTKNITRLAF